MKRTLLIGTAVLAGTVGLLASPAGAEHDHFLRTPGGCHQVASGSTARHHQFHLRVHEPVGKHGGPLDPGNLAAPHVGLSTTPC